MNSEKQKVLEMLANGTISAEEAERLLECLEEDAKKEAAGIRLQKDDRTQGKKLRVQVNGCTEEDGKINVNVSVPLVLARYADNIIANCIPASADKELKENGFDLRSLKIGEIIDTIENLDEDIANVDIVQDATDLKVRVYVE
ncbi:SHOCT-like domain-containing protein [Candidatus Soleaferrea massiliensis]|uniref:SHOCT-like domain-containing protein n=1 Tax=Candidatus Soleaferrea massiliensis TaxID=1470354 RepID=UPI00058B48F5|nr:hypothetical protein [Candidatus Soleaferrea massiliensis]